MILSIPVLDATTMFNHFLIRLAFLDSWLDLVLQKADDIFGQVENRLIFDSEDIGGMV